ncbi:F-box protein SKIP23 [Linum grandiflorum]
MADWSYGLPLDLLDRIVNLIDDEIDLLHFRSICSSWRSSAVRTGRRHRGCLTTASQVIPTDGLLPGFWWTAESHIQEHTIYLINDTLDLGGWLVDVKDRECKPYGKRLCHPLRSFPFGSDPRHENTESPSAFDVRKYRVKRLNQLYVWRMGGRYIKAAMKWSSSQEFVLLSIHATGDRLVKYDSQDQKWAVLDPSVRYQDVILHKGKLVAVDSNGGAVMVGEYGEVIVVAYGSLIPLGNSRPEHCSAKKYLVQSKEDGELLLVDKYPDLPDRPSRPAFKVYKLNEEEKKWVDVGNSLGDDVLFIGYGSAFAASLYSDLLGYSAKNCIIFVDNLKKEGIEEDHSMPELGRIYVFDLYRGDLMPLTNSHELSKLFWPPPPWLSSKLLHPYVDYNDID